MYVGNESVLALYASGRVNGVVFDSGHGVSHAVPVLEGYPLQHAIQMVELSGREVTDCLMQLLNERGYVPYSLQFSSTSKFHSL